MSGTKNKEKETTLDVGKITSENVGVAELGIDMKITTGTFSASVVNDLNNKC